MLGCRMIITRSLGAPYAAYLIREEALDHEGRSPHPLCPEPGAQA